MRAIETTTRLVAAAAEAAIRAALAEQGFGILTEIDVAAVFKAKLGIDRPFLKILGACNPTFAQRALQLDANVSLRLPCNITVEAVQDGTRVAAIDPLELMADPVFTDLVNEVSTRLGCAIDSLRPAIRTWLRTTLR